MLSWQSKTRGHECRSSRCLAAVHQQHGGGERDRIRAPEGPGFEVRMLLPRPPGKVDAFSLYPNCRCKVPIVRRQDPPRFQARCEGSVGLVWCCRFTCSRSSSGFRHVQASCVPFIRRGHVPLAVCLRTDLHCTCAKLCVGTVCTAATVGCPGCARRLREHEPSVAQQPRRILGPQARQQWQQRLRTSQ